MGVDGNYLLGDKVYSSRSSKEKTYPPTQMNKLLKRRTKQQPSVSLYTLNKLPAIKFTEISIHTLIKVLNIGS